MDYGCIKSSRDIRNYKIAKGTIIELPKEYNIGHSHIKNQGNVGSCVAHSVSEMLEAQDNNNYSTGWIYGYRPDDYYQGRGMYISEAIKTVHKCGYIKNELFDYNVEMLEAKNLVDKNLDKLLNEANKNKIASYAVLETIDDIKQAIYQSKTPVIMGIDIDKNGLKLDENFVAQIPTEPDGGHAVVCYGWNEVGFLIQNSWGEDWGDHGTFILPYEYPLFEAWVFSYQNENEIIEKPKVFWLRELIMFIIKIIKKYIR